MWELASWLFILLGLGFSSRYTWWRKPHKGVPVLMYHHITNKLNNIPSPKLLVTPKRFSQQLNIIKQMGYRTVTLSQALSFDKSLPIVAITFDDGYANFYNQAWPLLKERAMTATVFLVTGAIDGVNFWDHDKGEPCEALMTREQILELYAAGVEFGGHTHTHRNLTMLDNQDLQQEIINCQKALIKLLGNPSRVFSYPYGLFTPIVADIVTQAGFSAACSTRPGMLDAGTNPMMIPRIIIKRIDNSLDFRLKLMRCQSRL